MLSIEDIKKIVTPLAQSHGVERMFLFGSYARGEATMESDIDFHIDKGAITGLFSFANFLNSLEDALGVRVDLLTTESLRQSFRDEISSEEILIYDIKQTS